IKEEDARTLNREIGILHDLLARSCSKETSCPVINDNGTSINVMSDDVEVCFDKKTGNLTHIAHNGDKIVNSAAGLHAYHDKPYREDCWNLMLEWWKHEKPLFPGATVVSIHENGPVRWTVRAVHEFGSSSKAILDHSFTRNLPGFQLTIGIDFHETETLLKYRIPIPGGTGWSVAETPYATARRRNEPIANHDIPRWEKWMHTFVTMERDDASRGLAIINEGKYGFDTLNGHLGISIIRGPLYPGTNIVAWARDERKRRQDAGMGEPPLHADQGPHVARFWIVPYKGTWRDGRVHALAHVFNTRARACVAAFNGTIDDILATREAKNLKDNVIQDIIHDNGANQRMTWITVETGTIEVIVLKRSEVLPPFMEPLHGKVDGLVIRAINNSDIEHHARIAIHPSISGGYSSVIEVNLIEQPIVTTIDPRFSVDQESDRLVLSGVFKPHEIRTFKLLP
nr:glycoside hydrolase family 38 C-terminal domain-containing protein [Candidatus Sigynarchaeota archaeon]